MNEIVSIETSAPDPLANGSVSNVGGADCPNNIIITEIIDRTVTEEIPTDDALQPFY